MLNAHVTMTFPDCNVSVVSPELMSKSKCVLLINVLFENCFGAIGDRFTFCGMRSVHKEILKRILFPLIFRQK